MLRQHRMPFGAEVAPDGVHFRLWAPASSRVDLLLFNLRGDAVDAVLPMAAQAEGWFALTVPAAAGQRYKYRIDARQEVPDPASRFNPQDVERPCEVIDPAAFAWSDGDWRGRPWHEAVIYQLHVGTFTPEGTFRAAQQRLPYLKDLGVTFIQLLPVAEFPGQRSWGYDGVLQYAPDAAYGRPEDLKALVDAAHAIGIGVLLDVVYNHFGPQGNYLHHYAPQFFSNRYRTPWGEAIDFEGRAEVRAFFIHNALYWLHEYRFENRPDQRRKHSVFLQGKYFMDGKVLDMSWRYMTDDWGIDSHMLDATFRWPLGERSWLEPHLRLYTQTEADFYRASLPAGELPAYASADYRLAAFDAFTAGIKYGRRTSSDNELAIRLEYYRQDGDIPADQLFGDHSSDVLYPGLDAIIVNLSYGFDL